MMDIAKINIGVSSCLLGEAVRYDGGHKRARYITDTLSRYFNFLPVCPEVAIGLGIPRPTIRLEGETDNARAMIPANDEDVTDRLDEYGRKMGKAMTNISGYILKSRSPSCGMERVKVYDNNGMPSAAGIGIYAGALMETQPLLPVEEEGRLNDPALRDNFLEQVFLYNRWQNMVEEGITAGSLVQFHTEHKYLIMSYNQNTMRELGRLISDLKDGLEEIANNYIKTVMVTMKKPAKRSNQVNVLQHIAGFFKDNLSAEDRHELNDAIDNYRVQEVPIIVPLTLIRHHIRRNASNFLNDQVFLERRPAALDTRRR